MLVLYYHWLGARLGFTVCGALTFFGSVKGSEKKPQMDSQFAWFDPICRYAIHVFSDIWYPVGLINYVYIYIYRERQFIDIWYMIYELNFGLGILKPTLKSSHGRQPYPCWALARWRPMHDDQKGHHDYRVCMLYWETDWKLDISATSHNFQMNPRLLVISFISDSSSGGCSAVPGRLRQYTGGLLWIVTCTEDVWEDAVGSDRWVLHQPLREFDLNELKINKTKLKFIDNINWFAYNKDQ